MLAGLEYTSGDYVAIMDADLQDPPELIEEMYDGIVKEGYDCVGLRRVTRKGEPPIRSFFARMLLWINK
jgi:glycosyltransferase involved in cell wall biosynthesis